jgi:hypothetical protein
MPDDGARQPRGFGSCGQHTVRCQCMRLLLAPMEESSSSKSVLAARLTARPVPNSAIGVSTLL